MATETNIDMMGSEFEKNVKLSSAESENEWKTVGKEAGIKKWRIEKFKVVPSPANEFSTFYSGDSYILICSKKTESGALKHDIHFWQGLESSQDEKGVSAYKTMELDTYLGGAPVQHREVQGFESKLFMSYFKEFRILEGGIDSGFNRIKPTEYKPRLLHCKGNMKICTVRQVPLAATSVNSGDVFVLDCGLKIYQFQGKECSGAERIKAATFARALDDEREGKPEIVVFEESDSEYPEAWTQLVGKGPYKTAAEGGSDKAQVDIRKLYKVSDASGKLEFTLLAEGKDLKRSLVTSEDAFILHNGSELCVWIGKGASPAEKKNAFTFAQKYIADNKLHEHTPVHRCIEGGENEVFESVFQ